MKDYNFQNMNFQNFNINGMMKMIYIISFIFQWSILSMIINLFTLGIIRIPLFLIFILDAISMLIIKNKSIKAPSFILQQLHKLISRIFGSDYASPQNMYRHANNINTHVNTASDKIHNTKDKFNNFIQNMNNKIRKDNKYKQERQLNKFSQEVGKKVTVQSISEGKITSKSFKYKDRTLSYIHTLEANGYKNYTHYNLDIKQAKAYIILNNNNDIIDVENNKIKCAKNDKNYKFLINQWPI